MLRILFTAEDLASTRFVPDPAPILETKPDVRANHQNDLIPRGRVLTRRGVGQR